MREVYVRKCVSLIAVLTVVVSTLARAEIWISDAQRVYRLSADLNGIAASKTTVGTLKLGVDPLDSSVWVLTNTKLQKLDPAGSLLFERDLGSMGLEGAIAFSVDGRDGSVWVGEGGGSATSQNKAIGHVDRAGQLVGTLPSPGGLSAIFISPDGSLWILGKKQLFRYSTQGALTATFDLQPFAEGEPKNVQIDFIRQLAWIAGETRILRLDLSTSSGTVVAIPGSIAGIALDQVVGRLFALVGDSLRAYDQNASLLWSAVLGVNGARTIAVESVSGTVVVGHGTGISTVGLGASTSVPHTLGINVGALGVRPLTVDAALSITEPANSAVVRNPRQPVRLALSTTCSSRACAFDAAQLPGSGIVGTLDAQPIVFVAEGNGSFVYQPLGDLAQGTHSVTVRYGTSGTTTTVSFTVDSIAPSISLTSPADGAIVSATSVPVIGQVSEPASVQIDGQAVPLGADGSFTFSKPLLEGSNSFVITATDNAGNSSSRVLTVIRDSIPPALTGLLPADGSTASTASVSIRGDVNEYATITVSANGSHTTTTGTSFSIPVTLIAGANTIAIVAVDRAGNQTTASLRVTFGSPLLITDLSPADNSTVSGDTAYVQGRVVGAGVFNVTVNGVLADIFGDRFLAAVPLDEGLNLLQVGAVAQSGASATVTLTISAVSNGKYTPVFGPLPLTAPALVMVSPPRGVRMRIDFNGDGIVDRVGDGPANITFTLTNPGVHQIKSEITDSTGTYNVTTPLVVHDNVALDTMLRGILDGMRARLRTRDVEGALVYFTPAVAEEYREVFLDIGDDLPAAADQLGTLGKGYVMGSIAQYVLMRNVNGVTQAFLVYLTRGPDGVWRISQL